MTPQPQHRTTIIFKNSIQIDGIVAVWDENEIILNSPANSHTIVIPKSSFDEILFWRISHAKEEYEKRKQFAIKSDDDKRDMAKLKIELNNLEKEEIRDKLRSHEIGESKGVQYATPFTTLAGIKQHPTAQIRRQGDNPNQELQNLFSKKH